MRKDYFDSQVSQVSETFFWWHAIIPWNKLKNIFKPMFHFCIPWKYQKTGGFLMFSGGIEVEHWLKMG